MLWPRDVTPLILTLAVAATLWMNPALLLELMPRLCLVVAYNSSACICCVLAYPDPVSIM